MKKTHTDDNPSKPSDPLVPLAKGNRTEGSSVCGVLIENPSLGEHSLAPQSDAGSHRSLTVPLGKGNPVILARQF